MRPPGLRLALWTLAVASLGAASGCSTLARPAFVDQAQLSASADADADTDRPTVPDAVMLRDHVGSQYHDSLSP